MSRERISTTILVILTLLLFLVSCGGSNKQHSNQTSNDNSGNNADAKAGYEDAPCKIGVKAKETEELIMQELGQVYGPELKQIVKLILVNSGMDVPFFNSLLEQKKYSIMAEGLDVEKAFDALAEFNKFVVNCAKYKNWITAKREEAKKKAELAEEMRLKEPKENANRLLNNYIFRDSKSDTFIFVYHNYITGDLDDLNSYDYWICQATKFSMSLDGKTIEKKELTELQKLNNEKQDTIEWKGKVKIDFENFRFKEIKSLDNETINQTPWSKWERFAKEFGSAGLSFSLEKNAGEWSLINRSVIPIAEANINLEQYALNNIDFPKATSMVNDFVGLLKDDEKNELITKLQEFESKTTCQIVVGIMAKLPAGMSIEQYSLTLFNDHWQPGQKGRNNGVIFLVFSNDRIVRINVGLGLEKQLTDAVCEQILTNDVLPHFRNGDYYQGIKRGTERIIEIILDDK